MLYVASNGMGKTAEESRMDVMAVGYNIKYTEVIHQSQQKLFLWLSVNSGESNGKLPLKTCPGCSVPEPYQLPDWALVSAQTGPRAEYQ